MSWRVSKQLAVGSESLASPPGALLGELLVTLPDAGSPVGGIGGGLLQFGDEVVLACGDVVMVAASGLDGALVLGGFWRGMAR